MPSAYTCTANSVSKRSAISSKSVINLNGGLIWCLCSLSCQRDPDGKNLYSRMFSFRKETVSVAYVLRDEAEPGSAMRSGRRGRRFESWQPDQPRGSSPSTTEGFLLSWRAKFT